MNSIKRKEIVTKHLNHIKKLKKTRPKAMIKKIIMWSLLSTISSIIIAYFFIAIFPRLPISEGPFAKMQAYALASRKIAYKALFKEDTQIPGNSAEEIVGTIVKERTKNNYLYTGGHYTDFYIRNLGTFANKLLDPKAAQNPDEWLDRVKLMTRSTELALGVFESYDEITTTIVELENGKYVPINVYVEPSDSLPSILKTIYQLERIDQANLPYVLTDTQKEQLLSIKQQAFVMESKYEKFLSQQSERYITRYTDSSGLIRPNVALSGIKDSWIRHSSLYDNVMLWSVYHYSYELGIKPEWHNKDTEIKTKLIQERWNDSAGIFYDERPQNACFPKTIYTPQSPCPPYFSADNLITYEMGMLSPFEQTDKYYLTRIIEYIRQKKLDQPFPLKTTEVRIPSKEHLPVRLFAPNYTGTTIWSYWGMVYIDILDTLGKLDNDYEYRASSQAHLNTYSAKIQQYHGFPELYAENGNEFRLFFYRSVNDMVWGIYYLYLENKVPTESTSSWGLSMIKSGS